jgi:hypothetical protein
MDNSNTNQQSQPTLNPEDFQKQDQQYEQGQYNQQYQYNNSYNQQPTYPLEYDLEEPVSFGDWMLTLLLMAVPVINIIMAFIWAFGSGTKKSKSNYFKAYLAWTLITIIVTIVLIIVSLNSISAVINGVEPYL